MACQTDTVDAAMRDSIRSYWLSFAFGVGRSKWAIQKQDEQDRDKRE
jgi:hypothetical protein